MADGLEPVISAALALELWKTSATETALRRWFRSAIWSMGTQPTGSRRRSYPVTGTRDGSGGVAVHSCDGPRPSNDGPRGHALSARQLKAALLEDEHLFLDVVGDVERAFWRAVETSRLPTQKVEAWLTDVTKYITWRLATPHVRGLVRAVQPAQDNDPVAALLDDHPGPEDLVALEQVRRRLQEALSQLAPADKELLAAWNQGGKTSAEIGDERGIPAGRVRVRIHRLLKRLRKMVL